MQVISQAFEINGAPQWVYLHLQKHAKTTLFFLHGGPGWADAPWAHHTCKELWKTFNTIHWDQRGSNRSYIEPPDVSQMTVSQLVADGLSLTELVKQKYGLGEIYLVGHSWGSMLAALMAIEAPGLFKGVIGVGQLATNHVSEPLSLEYCLTHAAKKPEQTFLSELNAMNSRFYHDVQTLFRQREILFELGGEFASPMTTEKYYSLMNSAPAAYRSTKEKMFSGCQYSMHCLWNEVIELDLFDKLEHLKTPIWVLQGRHDYCTASEVAKRWFDVLPRSVAREFIWFENSGHWPQLEETEKFNRFFFENF